ncbi:MAG: hypothetical protein U0354_02075 [Candidatus Sericytochromatia bacterium]
MDNENFIVRFDHIIAPNINLNIQENKVIVLGTVKISIDSMLKEFTKGLGLKSVFDHIVEKFVDEKGYHLIIKNIANADIFVKDNKLYVSATYMSSKEWWAKPVAVLVLGKLLNDFAWKIENTGIEPGFRDEIRKAMQQLRKNNYAILDLNNLFENQFFYINNFKFNIYNFKFEKIQTYSEDGVFVIRVEGLSDIKRSIK